MTVSNMQQKLHRNTSNPTLFFPKF